MKPTTKTSNTKRPQNFIIKSSLKILSWNIQAPSTTEGNKFQINEFKNKLISHDFVCLQEIRNEICLPGFKAFCNTRKNSPTGGVGILIKNEYAKGVDSIECVEGFDYVICKLKK